MRRFQTAKLGLALILSLTLPFSGFAKDKKKDVEAIGDRDVGKGQLLLARKGDRPR